MKRLAMLVLFIMALPSCASIIEGRTQELEVSSTPSGAQCQLIQGNETIGQLTTPGTITVEKSSDDIVIECRKAGYRKASVVNNSKASGWTYANVVTLGLGYGVDSFSGAANSYQDRVHVSLVRSGKTAGRVADLGPGPRSGSQGFPPIGTQSSISSYPSPAQTPPRSYSPAPASTAAMMPGPDPVLPLGAAPPRGAMAPGPAAAASYGVLFASYDSVAQASQGWQQVWNRHWSELSGVTPYIEYGTVGGGANRYNLYGKTATRDHASRLCQGLRQRGAACTMVSF